MPFGGRSHLPTTSEMRILNAVWLLGEATVEEIVQSFPTLERPNYKTTQAFLRIMENKGFVRHSVRGRVFVFQAVVKKEEIDQRSVAALLSQNFGGATKGLFLHLLESGTVAERELDVLEQMIQDYRRKKTGAASA